MYSKKRMWIIMAVGVAVMMWLGVFSMYLSADDFVHELEIRNVKEALSSYFAEHHRYPESLDVFVEQSILQRDVQKHIEYFPRYGYGSYKACYKDEQIAVLFGPPFSEESQHVKLMRLQESLMRHYRRHSHFPKSLLEFAHKSGSCCNQEISEGNYSYSVSEDLQSFTLEGDTFGAPPPRLSSKELDRVSRIGALAEALDGFQLRIGRYPKDLKELVSSDAEPVGLRKLLEGEDFTYEVSEDGKWANLEGEDVKSIIDKDRRRIEELLGEN